MGRNCPVVGARLNIFEANKTCVPYLSGFYLGFSVLQICRSEESGSAGRLFVKQATLVFHNVGENQASANKVYLCLLG